MEGGPLFFPKPKQVLETSIRGKIIGLATERNFDHSLKPKASKIKWDYYMPGEMEYSTTEFYPRWKLI